MSTSSVRRRRSAPVSCYVGPNGGGKTLCMMRDMLPSIRAGRPILSTVAVLEATSGGLYDGWTPLVDWRQLMTWKGGEVALDEVTGVASAREGQRLPAQLANAFTQLRRSNTRLRWTSPAFMRADKLLREVTQLVTVCRGYVSGPPPPLPDDGLLDLIGARIADARGVEYVPEPVEPPPPGVEQWPSKKLFRFRSFDAADIASAEAQSLVGVHARVKPVVAEWWHRGSDSMAAASYSTLAAVTALNTLTDAGLCVECGGTRTRPRCSCPVAH